MIGQLNGRLFSCDYHFGRINAALVRRRGRFGKSRSAAVAMLARYLKFGLRSSALT